MPFTHLHARIRQSERNESILLKDQFWGKNKTAKRKNKQQNENKSDGSAQWRTERSMQIVSIKFS